MAMRASSLRRTCHTPRRTTISGATCTRVLCTVGLAVATVAAPRSSMFVGAPVMRGGAIASQRSRTTATQATVDDDDDYVQPASWSLTQLRRAKAQQKEAEYWANRIPRLDDPMMDQGEYDAKRQWVIGYAAFITLPTEFNGDRPIPDGPMFMQSQNIITGEIAIVVGVLLFLWSAQQLYFTDQGQNGELVKSGPYGFVRHPMALASIIIALGVLLITYGTLRVIVFYYFCASLSTLMGLEDIHCAMLLGEPFMEYRKEVPTKIIPLLA